MTDARVLALIPAFNPNPEVLVTSLKSMLNQTVPVDVCIIDDGSHTPVADLIPKDFRVHNLRLPRNSGITAALRAGVDFGLEHQYEYFCRLDVGDTSYPHRVGTQLAYMQEHPEIDLLGAFSRIVSIQGNEIGLHGIKGGPKSVQRYLRKNAAFKHSTFFIRAEALRRNGSYDAAFPIAQDYELACRLAAMQKVDCLPDVLIEYIDDPTGISAKRRNKQLWMRLKVQMRYSELFTASWYIGLARTLGLMLTPHRIAKKMSEKHWGSTTRYKLDA